MRLFKAVKKPVPVLVEDISEDRDLKTLEGILHADAQKDYIIHGVNGELYPIKKEIFKKTYDVIGDKD